MRLKNPNYSNFLSANTPSLFDLLSMMTPHPSIGVRYNLVDIHNSKDDRTGVAIELALPGWMSEDLKVTWNGDIFNVSSEGNKLDNIQAEAGESYTYQGISEKAIDVSFSVPRESFRFDEAYEKNGLIRFEFRSVTKPSEVEEIRISK